MLFRRYLQLSYSSWAKPTLADAGSVPELTACHTTCASWLCPPKADTVVFTVLQGFGHFPVRSWLFKKNYATFITSDTMFFLFSLLLKI